MVSVCFLKLSSNVVGVAICCVNAVGVGGANSEFTKQLTTTVLDL